jgi:hypothetical protein
VVKKCSSTMNNTTTTAEVFAAMKEAVTGDGGKALQRKFKVGCSVIVSNCKISVTVQHSNHRRGMLHFTSS